MASSSSAISCCFGCSLITSVHVVSPKSGTLMPILVKDTTDKKLFFKNPYTKIWLIISVNFQDRLALPWCQIIVGMKQVKLHLSRIHRDLIIVLTASLGAAIMLVSAALMIFG